MKNRKNIYIAAALLVAGVVPNRSTNGKQSDQCRLQRPDAERGFTLYRCNNPGEG